jgi:hypothetical protein
MTNSRRSPHWLCDLHDLCVSVFLGLAGHQTLTDPGRASTAGVTEVTGNSRAVPSVPPCPQWFNALRESMTNSRRSPHWVCDLRDLWVSVLSGLAGHQTLTDPERASTAGVTEATGEQPCRPQCPPVSPVVQCFSREHEELAAPSRHAAFQSFVVTKGRA